MEIAFVDVSRNDQFGDLYDVVVDALFGFSFRPPVRPEFEEIMRALKASKAPICSIDVPSGKRLQIVNYLYS